MEVKEKGKKNKIHAKVGKILGGKIGYPESQRIKIWASKHNICTLLTLVSHHMLIPRWITFFKSRVLKADKEGIKTARPR